MPSFSEKSLDKLHTCHPLLQMLFASVIVYYDCTIVEGHRDKTTQNKYFKNGKSKLKWPKGKHNQKPSLAVDAAPYIPGKGIVWNASQCYHFAGFVLGIASQLNIPIRWGGDWDGDTDISDQTFNDLVHFELKL